MSQFLRSVFTLARSAAVSMASLVIVFPMVGVAMEQVFDSDGVSIRYLDQGEGSAIVLVHGFTGGSGWSGEHDAENYQQIAEALTTSGSFGPMLAAAWPEGQTPSSEDIAAVDALLAGNDLQALAQVAKAMPDIINLTESEVAGIAVPVLSITGELDPERGNHERMRGVVPNLTLVVIEGADHMAAFTHPEFHDAVRRFITDRPLY
jgi:pimeloyl-ACP methyl ester carboxylesterase